ncbi:acyl-phosphate glycerol 3-phosphate acyltransferase [Saccharobesus litoralis]|uniref:Glycerol-3-phosphate acyltransferase n=1 Tax=Saccharobesus litoralis TaxID=2172099 RepID=A0A2S0VRP4_9ALTE|nr:glycerol-3-phosphate 1-O-acyltransferase PlsY [Saccharobesus litoralis]AWB66879.1 acyl-phosphate glycerol 3-phosphate acyltransferase [Saccharobesus litoralis]
MTNLFWPMLVIAYLIGSLSGARLAHVFFRTPNPLTHGSGNPGATNMYRIGGAKAAAFTFLFDTFKAVIPVYGSYFLGLPPIELGIIAIIACMGHIWPVYYRFKGGKGVATAFGSMLPLGLDLGLLLVTTWTAVLYKSRFSSLASITTAGIAPLYVYFLKPDYVYPSLMLCLLIVGRHTANIRRLLDGNERTMDEKHLSALRKLKRKAKRKDP